MTADDIEWAQRAIAALCPTCDGTGRAVPKWRERAPTDWECENHPEWQVRSHRTGRVRIVHYGRAHGIGILDGGRDWEDCDECRPSTDGTPVPWPGGAE